MEKLESGNAVLQTIHSSEGGRALKLLNQRQKQQKELDDARIEIESETKKRRLHKIDEKYHGSTTEALEEEFRMQTVGLVSVDEFRERRRRLEELKEQKEEESAASVCSAKRQRKTTKATLSFQLDDEDVEESQDEQSNKVKSESSEIPSEPSSVIKKKKYFGKDPSVDTSFLADALREENLRAEEGRLVTEYYENLEREKQDILEVTYSYWDGSGHRRNVQIKKGNTIGQFLNECRKTLEADFPELRSVPNDNLMYIKEDLILPHNVTFHDLIRSRARGKSGPLFNFDVHEDVRLKSDIRIEKDESHAGKIVDRKWFEKNKHIFPASRWEAYDPNKTFEKYTIHGNQDYSQQLF